MKGRTQEPQEGSQTCDQATPTPEKVNHEGQPRPQTSQPTDTEDTAVQKLTHPKVRESQQGDDTVVQRADTTPTGAPWHRVQNPANPCKPAGAGEAQKKKGRADAQPTSPGKQKDRHPVTWKSPREPAAGQAAQAAGPGGRARHMVENQATHQKGCSTR